MINALHVFLIELGISSAVIWKTSVRGSDVGCVDYLCNSKWQLTPLTSGCPVSRQDASLR